MFVIEVKLDVIPEDLQKFILVGKEKLNAHLAKIRAIEKVGEAYAAKEAALSDAQDLGDALLDAESKLGEMLEETVHDRGNITLGSHGRTKSLPPGITKKDSHYTQTLSKNRDLIEEVIEEAYEKGTIPTRKDVLKKIQKHKQFKPIENVPLPENKYRTIVVDPPWPIEKILREERPLQDSFDYKPMTLEEIEAFNITDIAADDSHLYLWTTQKHIHNAFHILEVWGFKYQCMLTWVKNVGFTPFSFMYSTEHVLFGRRGSLDLLQKGLRLDS